MKISRALRYKFNSKYWELNFLKRIQGLSSIKIYKKTYKWWNPFCNIRVCRDSMNVYGPALYYIKKNNIKKVLDFGCALGMGTFLMNGDGTECVGLEIDKDKVDFCNKVFPEIRFYNLKDTELNEKFDAIVCSYSISPREKELKHIIDHYAPICITINSNLKGINGTRIGKNTIVSGDGVANKIDFIFLISFFFLNIKYLFQRIIEKRRKFISCLNCLHVLTYEDVNNKKIKCKNCGYEDDRKLTNFDKYIGFKKEDFI